MNYELHSCYVILDKQLTENKVNNFLQANWQIDANNRQKITHEKTENDIVPIFETNTQFFEPNIQAEGIQLFGKEVYLIELLPTEIQSFVDANIPYLDCFVFQGNTIYDYDLANDIVLFESEVPKKYYL